MKRPTPHFEDWRAAAKRRLAEHGRKAELARHLSKAYGRLPRSWESNIGQILAGTLLPNAEVLMAINAWLERTDGKPLKTANSQHGRKYLLIHK